MFRMQGCRAWSSISTPMYTSDYGDKQANCHIRLNNEARLDHAAWFIFLESFNDSSILCSVQW